MNNYSPLIRKLVEATAEAESQGKDIVDLLKQRCFNETSIIRKTIMNAVCDPRFKLYANTVGFWKTEARSSLEELARILSGRQDLTEEVADDILESFLSAWFKMTFDKIATPPKPTPSYKSETKSESENNIEDGLKLMAEVEEEFEKTIPKPSPNINQNKSTSSNHQKQDTKTVGVSEATDNSQDDNETDSEQQEQQKMHGGGHRSNTKKWIEKIEEKYLHKIPDSLVQLARQIGRMGSQGNQKEGRFMMATKSDISGITVGNDISAVLPSELALLADHKTQTIFYKNYAAKKLQIFSSASQVNSPDKHQDGPVIICVDSSSSMCGTPLLVAKALTLAVAIIAWRRKRNVFVIRYSYHLDYLNSGCDRSRLGELSKFLSVKGSGGNDENHMFQWLFENVANNLDDYTSADILCVSDFGWIPLSKKTEDLINEQKKKGLRLFGLNVTSSFSSLVETDLEDTNMNICDSVWVYDHGECKEIGKRMSMSS